MSKVDKLYYFCQVTDSICVLKPRADKRADQQNSHKQKKRKKTCYHPAHDGNITVLPWINMWSYGLHKNKDWVLIKYDSESMEIYRKLLFSYL